MAQLILNRVQMEQHPFSLLCDGGKDFAVFSGSMVGPSFLRLLLPFLLLSLFCLPIGSAADSDLPLLRIAGSSTVYPLVSAWAESLTANYSFTDNTNSTAVCDSTNSTICSGGSSQGAKRLCSDRSDHSHVDIGTMSREWTEDEAQILDDGYTYECLSTQQRFTQLTTGVDGVVVVFGTSGIAANCLLALGGLTVAQLRWVFSDWSEDTLANDADGQVDIESVTPNNNYNGIREWSDLSDECSAEPINTYGHSSGSGTRNFFAEVTLCKRCFDGTSGYTPEGFVDCDDSVHASLRSLSTSAEIAEFLSSERPANCYLSGNSDEEILEWVVGDPRGVAITGFAFYAGVTESLDAVRIASDTVYGVKDTTDALIEPSSYSIVDGSYSVFTRTLYLNVDNAVWPLVRPYLIFAYSELGLGIVDDVGYVAVNTALRAKLLQRIELGANPAADYIPVAPEECPIGTELVSSAYVNAYGTAKTLYECLPCQLGYVKANSHPTSCTACAAGSMAGTEGQSKCTTCEAGSFSPAGSSNCTLCPVNSAAQKPGAMECTPCDEGFVAGAVGATSCDRCAKGTYRSVNDTECIACPAQMTTAFLAATLPSDCACAEGLYLAEGGIQAEGPCEVCPDGLECPFGSAFEHFSMLSEDPTLTIPLLEAGLWTSSAEPLVVFKCRGDVGGDICPGGWPEQCTGGRMDVACSLCPNGQHWDGESCQTCSQIAAVLLGTGPFFLFMAVVLAYYFANAPLSSNLSVATAASTVLSQLLTVAQTLSMFGDLSIAWPGKVQGVFASLRVTVGSPDIGLECALGSKASALYGFRCALPAIVILELAMCYYGSKLLLWVQSAAAAPDHDAATLSSSSSSSKPATSSPLELDPNFSEAQHVEALAAQVDLGSRQSTVTRGQNLSAPSSRNGHLMLPQVQGQAAALLAAQASASGSRGSPSPRYDASPTTHSSFAHAAMAMTTTTTTTITTAVAAATATTTTTTVHDSASNHAKGWRPWTFDATLNTTGQMLQGLFIAVAAIVVVPFQCYKHPNGIMSLTKYPEVFCYEPGAHVTLIYLSSLVAFLFVIPFVVWCLFGTWAVVKYQTGVDRRLRVRYRFLLYRFRPDKWWWGGLFLFRQLALAFAPSLPADSPHGQGLYIILVLMAYGFAEAHFWPWKVSELNFLDMATTSGLIVVITGAMALVPRTTELKFFEWLLLFTLMSLAFGYVCILALLVRSGVRGVRHVMAGETSPSRISFGIDHGAFREDAEMRLFEAVTSLIESGPENFRETLSQMSRYDQMLVVKAFDAYVASKLPVQVKDMHHPRSRVLGLVRADIDEISVIRRSRRSLTSQTSGSTALRSHDHQHEQEHEHSRGSPDFFADLHTASCREMASFTSDQSANQMHDREVQMIPSLESQEPETLTLAVRGSTVITNNTNNTNSFTSSALAAAQLPLKAANDGHTLVQAYKDSQLRLNLEAGGHVDLDQLMCDEGMEEQGPENTRTTFSSDPSASYFDRAYPVDASLCNPGREGGLNFATHAVTSSMTGDAVLLHQSSTLFDL